MRSSALASVLIGLPAVSMAQATITLDDTVSHQTMSGWECTTFIADACSPTYGSVRDSVLERAVNDVGINRLRLEIRSGSENTVDHYANYVAAGCPGPPDPAYTTWRENRYATVNDNGDPAVIDWAGFHFTELDFAIEEVVLPMRDLLLARGEDLHVNLCYVAFTSQIVGGAYDHDDAAEYAEFVLATHLHMIQDYGFIPDTWEVILEPDLVSQWNGTGIGNAIAASADRLQAEGIDQRFVAPSNSTMNQILTYIDDMLAVPGALDALDMLSYHRYGANDATLQQIVNRADANGFQTGMLEWWFGNATYEVLHKDLTLGMNAAWQGRTLRSLFVLPDEVPTSLELARDTAYNRLYFKHIRSGATRIGASSMDGTLDAVAFVNDNGAWTVVVKATAARSFDVAGLPAGTYGLRYTTGLPSQDPLQDDVPLPDVTLSAGQPLSTAIPNAGLLTIHGLAPAVDVATDALPAGFTIVATPVNPVRRSAVLTYRLSRSAQVSVSVFDVSGRHVTEIQNERRDAGTHRVTWALESQAPGVYWWRFAIDGRAIATSKIVITG